MVCEFCEIDNDAYSVGKNTNNPDGGFWFSNQTTDSQAGCNTRFIVSLDDKVNDLHRKIIW